MKNKAFTLIELLVVIAIIGLLSTIVLISVSAVREKARIAAGLKFMSNLDHSLMPVGVWKLDGDAKDSSGYENDGTIIGADCTQEGIIDKYYHPGNCRKRQFLLARRSDQLINFWIGL